MGENETGIGMRAGLLKGGGGGREVKTTLTSHITSFLKHALDTMSRDNTFALHARLDHFTLELFAQLVNG